MEPELIKEVLNNHHIFKKPTPNPLAKFLVCGINGYEDDKWSKHRKIINPAFYLEKLRHMVPAMHRSCVEMIEKWEKLVKIEGKGEGIEIDVRAYFEDLTGQVISRTAFGSSYEEGRRIFELQKEQAELTRQVLQSVYVPGWRFLPTEKNKRMKEINREVQDVLRGIIQRREEAMRAGEKTGNDMLGILLESNSREVEGNGNREELGISTKEVIDECKLFYFAGQETTSNLLVWTMVMLGIHQNWQTQAREEVLQVFGKSNPDFDGLNQLKKVTMILHEVLRLYPPVPVIARAPTKTLRLGNITLPVGVDLMLQIGLLHHDPKIWGDDVNEFKPERFSEGISGATKGQLSFIPFSAGPRVCVGQQFAMIEAKLALVMILQKFSFELSSSYLHAPFSILTLQPQYGAALILHKL
ncbi:cytochrome [Sesamum angolense]|uniref:Cytochrome n=1 Tax=Sesamum angolense TaxID=2727404 RepID=A0AAE1WRL6_9LAMI|nr:cytochrome [Sesamum angolense]